MIRTGTDMGVAGKQFKALVSDRLDVHLIRRDRKNEPPHFGKVSHYRKSIEAIFGALREQLSPSKTAANLP